MRSARRFDTGLFVALWLGGLVATLSLLSVPMEALQPPGMGFTATQFRLLALVNPLILVTGAVAIGCLLAHRVGLDAPVVRALLTREAAGPALRAQLGPATLVGAGVAALLSGYGWLTADLMAGVVPRGFAMPLITKLLYGGIVEELLTRWGLMALFSWAAWRLTGARLPVRRGAYVAGAVAAALLFAAGHLPLLFMLMPDPPVAMVVMVLAGNAIPGLLFGWLFARHGLEAAIIAHALAHLLATLVS